MTEALKVTAAMGPGAVQRADRWTVYYYAFRITLVTLKRRRMKHDAAPYTRDEQRAAAELAFWRVIAQELTPTGTRGLVVVPNNQVLSYLRQKITDYSPWGVRYYSASDARLEFANGARVLFRNEQSRDIDGQFRGLELDWVWIPHPGSVSDRSFAVLRPALLTRRGRFYSGIELVHDAREDRPNSAPRPNGSHE